MGTEVHYKNSFPGYYSMRNVNEDSNSSSWPLFYGDNALTNGHYYNGFTPRTVTDAYPGYDKDELKQKMLVHEAIFKKQVYELHRLYRRQRDMMEEVKRKEFHKHQISIDTSSSSSLLPSQKPNNDAHKWQIPSFPLTNSTCARPSIFGAETSNSPLSCSKGNGSKDCEVLECRPSKVRKKLFDLQLPADEYIEPEEGEQIQDNQASEISSYPPKDNRFVPKNGVKAFLDGGGKKDGYKDASSGQLFTGALADLNEPVYVQEAIGDAPQSVNFLGPSAKAAAFNHLSVDGKGNGRERFSSYMHEPGNSRSDMTFTFQCFESNKLQTPSSDTMQRLHGKEVQHPGTCSEISARNQGHSHFNQAPLLFAANRISSPYPFVSTSDMGNSWSPLGSSWGMPNDGLTRKLTSFQTHPSFLSSPQSHEVFGDKWHRSDFYGTNTGSGSDLPACNGFYLGSSSGSKEQSARLPSVGFDYRNCNKLDDGSRKIFEGSNFIDLTDTTKGMDLNTVQTLSNEDDESRKCDQSTLPWLRVKPAICKNGSSCDQLCKNGDHVGGVPKEKDDSLANNRKLLGFPIFGNSCISKKDASSVVSTSASMEHRGIDINVAWDDAMASEPIDKRIDVETCNERREDTDAEIKNFKNHFDLNSCVTEDEDLLVSESVKSSKKMTMEIDLEVPAVSEIEEEAIQCGDEHKATERKPDHSESEELAKAAAEAIVVISGQQDHVGFTSHAVDNENNDDPLSWFVEVITSCAKNVGANSREMDEYEMLTLQLEETKEEDYMPTPLVPDFQEPDEGGPALPSRPRRGQARRGRPRRDFQRDILPGLVSLSRHEITEDLQVFGGLMRATGHSWNLGSTRRNGKRLGARGRRKVKVVETPPAATVPPPPPPPPPPPQSSKQLNNIEVVGLEERSLTGWGRTTRRPRRQRCAPGNSVAVQLT